jgi:hypothetical protein
MDLCDCCNEIADCNYTLIGNGKRWKSPYLVFNGVRMDANFIDEDDYGYITKDINIKEELLEFLPWIRLEDNDNDNFCVNCIKQLILDKKIFFHCIRRTIYPLYTDCCDTLLYHRFE